MASDGFSLFQATGVHMNADMVGVNSRLSSVSDALKVLPVSREALYRRIKSGDIPSYRFGRKVLLNVGECLEAMRSK